MKITDVVSFVGSHKFYVKVETDEGAFGFGESSPMRPPVLLAIMQSVIKPAILGMDPFQSEAIEERVMRRNYKLSGQLLAAAFSGVEIALWDLKGRWLGQPVYNLLGGRYRDHIPLYGSSMSRNLSPVEEAEKLQTAVAAFNFAAVKIKVGPRYGQGLRVDLDADEEKIKTVRKAIGPKVKLIIDGNGSYTAIQALELYQRVSDQGIHYFEEPCPYDDIEAYVRLAGSLPVPIHVGEQNWNLYTFRDFVSRGACHYYGADPIKCGGLANAKRAATLCRAFGVEYVPHNTTRSIGFAAAIHLAASTPECNTFYEYSIEPKSNRSEFWTFDARIENGVVEVGHAPGLGVSVDESQLAREFSQYR